LTIPRPRRNIAPTPAEPYRAVDWLEK